MWLIPLRYDVFYAVKELARSLASPTQHGQARLKHLLRYLRGALSYATVLHGCTQFSLGIAVDTNAYTDSDWAGCQKTCKSTSGTAVQVQGRTVIALSRTQQTLALSSGEEDLRHYHTRRLRGCKVYGLAVRQ